ncbi:5-hydroxytryptamine receptor 3A-like [Eucyclogobius newberryi]|uniref:5-hydroxytryptamine receptor 3A-like n=1 Tax=Eucyclogobius newberryi TaxID=166745 RepID=UPI003B58CC60
MFTRWCLWLLVAGGAGAARIVSTRPKGNSQPPKPPAVPPPGPSGDLPSLGFGVGDLNFTGAGVADPFRPWDPCSYEALAMNLMLKTPEKFQMFRPVKNHSEPLLVYLEMVIYSILDVKETDQTCVTCIWTFMSWTNENIIWSPVDYCGLNKITVPSDTLWKPDIIIEEVTENDPFTVAPYLSVYSDGLVELLSDQVVTSSCKMHVYKFPFDTQSCTLTFRSSIYSVEELSIAAVLDSEKVSAWTREKMKTQYEWVFIDMSVDSGNVSRFERNQDVIIFTINMRRRSVLYIVNFIFPVIFFLFLDFASFLMSDTGGEKLGFKITVLLAVTVMQLLLNEILPSSSDRIPLIAVYCVGIFSLMLLSLLESILIVHLINKDNDEKETSGKQDSCVTGVKDKYSNKSDEALCNNKSSLGEDTVAAELRDLKESLALILSRGKDEEKPGGYWAEKAKAINRYFFIFYIISAFIFLVFLFFVWIY